MVHMKTIAPTEVRTFLITIRCLSRSLLADKFILVLGKYCKQQEVRRIASAKEQNIYGKVSQVLLPEVGR